MRYVLVFAVPAFLASVIVAHSLATYLGLSRTGTALVWLLPAIVGLALLSYPFALAERRRLGINHAIHLFITHLGVLATSNLSRVEIFHALSKKKEYGPLAEEAYKVHELVKRWNMSLSDACRFVAKRTASAIFADFLERFAYALDAGDDFEAFLRQEQIVVMEAYGSLYRGRLYEVENLKGLFMSLVMSLVFMMIFVLILPMLTGSDPTVLIAGAVVLVVLVEVFFIGLAKNKAPRDPVWYVDPTATRLSQTLRWAIPVSLLAIVIVAGGLLYFTRWPPAIIIAASLSPLLLPGVAAAREETRVRRRDENFAAFVRSLGASAGVRGGAVKEVLRTLRGHDFGPLTEDIRSLHHRLNLQVDDGLAWRYFAAEAGSNLIDKFSAMFMEGVRAGGKPEAIGVLLSENFVRILSLRRQRLQIADSLRGLFYGLAAGVALALSVGLGVLKMVMDVFAGVTLPDESLFIGGANVEVPLAAITFAVIVVLLVHVATSALMIRIASGGTMFAAWVDFVGMFWVSAGAMVVSEHGLASLLHVATA